jgi:chromate transporter
MAELALLTWTFLWLSLLCVGGGLGVIPEMERQSVTIHGWLTAREFVDGYTLTQLTPGPNVLIAVFVGYRAHGVLGGILAGLAMFVPTSVLAMMISHHWQQWRTRRWAATAERALIPVGIGLMAGGRLHPGAHRDPRHADPDARGAHRPRGGLGPRAAGARGPGRGRPRLAPYPLISFRPFRAR